VLWSVRTFYGNLLTLTLMVARDWRRGRLMKQFVLSAAALVALQIAETLLYFWAPWKEVTAGWVHAWARQAG
jgi:hypothetical protein